MIIDTNGGVGGSLRHSKTGLGWKSKNATVGQGALLPDVPDPWTENVIVQEEMNLTTKRRWSENAKEIVDGGRRVAGGERAVLITRGDE